MILLEKMVLGRNLWLATNNLDTIVEPFIVWIFFHSIEINQIHCILDAKKGSSSGVVALMALLVVR